ncbi:DUF3732 domain-containing protein [Agrobacterium pusense]|uniref:DUF3732 domain-containing protein n=1 Tax=Agrobacterium pusense TaxID=648995 RepID=UPI000D33DD7F|nr:DUF3732 domain-containing protein [Agrobacterium pusense]PTV71610.1 DUF3732 domain-containing protein [Agrobacterium pusense]
MSIQVRGIAIYSRSGEKRETRFKLNSLNVVTGASKTGKSALLDIVDFCWGRDECTVPRGEIRNGVSWFAVLFDNAGEGILVARHNPGPSGNDGDEIYFERNVDEFPDGPTDFVKNMTAAALRSKFSGILGIAENLSDPDPAAGRRQVEASAGQAIFFSLQAQDEIASRRLLFHRQGETGIAQAIRDTFPYFLGAMGEDYFLKKKRLDDAKFRLRKLERELAEARALANEASGTAISLVSEARRVGLLDANAFAETPDAARELLRQAAIPRSLSYATLANPEADLADLEDRRRQLRAELQEIREEIKQLNRLVSDASAFEREADEQRVRLASIELLVTADGAHDTCPLCESHLKTSVPAVDEMRQSLSGIELQLRSVRKDSPRVQARISDLEGIRTQREVELEIVQTDITTRIAENERLRIEQDQFTEQARVAGRISYYLDNVRIVAEDNGLRLRVARVRAEVDALTAELDQDALNERVSSAISVVGRDLTTFATALRLEHGENSLRIDLRNLTVVADTIHGPLPLAQIGSGENWVGYHVAAHLALHRLFRARARPIPAFLMLDQPSQAHYPPERDLGEISGNEDEDQVAVARLYRVLYDYCADPDQKMQIIVADHVELLEEWFRSVIAERWRDGIKLVPVSWTGVVR